MDAQLVLDSLGIETNSLIGAVNSISDSIRSSSSPNMFSVGILRSFGVDTGKSSLENQYLARAAVEYAVKAIKTLDEPTVDGMNSHIKDRVAGLRVTNPDFFKGETEMENQVAELVQVSDVVVGAAEASEDTVEVSEAPKGKRGRKPDLAKQEAVCAILREKIAITNVRGDIVRIVMERFSTSYPNARNYVLKAEASTGITLKSYDK